MNTFIFSDYWPEYHARMEVMTASFLMWMMIDDIGLSLE
jgi:hypothetical protein